MSGFVIILDLHDRAVDRLLLDHLTDFLSTRGPDARAIYTDGPAGLGFTFLSVSDDTPDPHQPRTLAGNTWITGDVRLDARDELKRRLCDRGVDVSPTVCDADLVLQAYAVWGEGCTDQLLGDFAFVLWDAQERRLFAARDHFGVKPFYFTEVGGCFLASNTLACLLRHPEVSSCHNEQAIGDFLVFGHNCDLATTTFAAIRRLPPAHALSCCDGRVRTWRYWELPRNGNTRYQREEEYVEHFLEVLKVAVADRMRNRRVGVLMSGGLDSTAVAALARECQLGGEAVDLKAFTVVYDRLIPDTERHYASVAADALRLPIQIIVADDYRPFTPGASGLLPTPEPLDDPVPALFADQCAQFAGHSHVLLTGFGGDPLLSGSPAYMMNLLSTFQWPRWLMEVVRYAWPRRRLPPLGLRSAVKRWLGWPPPKVPYPNWLAPDFARRIQLRRRFDNVLASSTGFHSHHAEAYHYLSVSFWPAFFESFDAGVTGNPLEVRHPFFDVRLVDFTFSVPSLPWCADKEILRESMRGRLPEGIRLRPKTPLAGAPLIEWFRGTKTCWASYFADANPELAKYVSIGKLERLIRSTAAAVRSYDLQLTRPLCLSFWLDRCGLKPTSVR
jgi:asparagine synthase (glutamine-hydrolysing)